MMRRKKMRVAINPMAKMIFKYPKSPLNIFLHISTILADFSDAEFYDGILESCRKLMADQTMDKRVSTKTNMKKGVVESGASPSGVEDVNIY